MAHQMQQKLCSAHALTMHPSFPGCRSALPKYMLINSKSQAARRGLHRHCREGTISPSKMASTRLIDLPARARWDMQQTTRKLITRLVVICAEKHRICLKFLFLDSLSKFVNVCRPAYLLQKKLWSTCGTVDLYNDEVSAIVNRQFGSGNICPSAGRSKVHDRQMGQASLCV
jgi:hypothetical protein